jgi:hypothetical protein
MTINNPKVKIPLPRVQLTDWQMRKQQRREKQRTANVGRALKMHAARMAPELALPEHPVLPVLNVGWCFSKRVTQPQKTNDQEFHF